MDTTIGTTQTAITLTSLANTSANTYYFTRFVSHPINQSGIAANTWTYNFATRENNINANFPVGSLNTAVPVNIYVWRPGTGVVGTILDGNTAANYLEGGAATEVAQHGTLTGAAVAGAAAGDHIIIEVWFTTTQGNTTARTDEFFFDGTTVGTSAGGTVSNHASFLETPENITFGAKSLARTASETVTLTESLSRQRTAGPGSPQNIKVGIITKDSTSGAHTQNFTNECGFSPQWGIFIMSGKTAAGSGAHIQNSVGFTDGTNHYCIIRRCIDGNNSGSTNGISTRNTDNFTVGADSVAGSGSATTLSEGRVDFGSNGFDIIWDKADTIQNKIIYLIGGGGGFDDAIVKSQTVGTTPWQYTNIGMQGDIVFLLASQAGALDAISNGPGIGLGVATSSTSRWETGMSTATGFATNGQRFQRTDRCYQANINGSTARELADFDGFLSNGYDLTFSTSTATDAFGALVISGGLWDIGAFNQATSNGTQQVNITTGRTPKALLLATFGNTSTTSNVADARLSIGFADGTTETCIWDGFQNGAASSYNARSDYSESKLIRTLDETVGGQTLQTEADWSAFASGSFTINNTTTDATSREICYVTFTSDAVTGANIERALTTETMTISDSRTISRNKIRTRTETVTASD